jgi:hypothetical protein
LSEIKIRVISTFMISILIFSILNAVFAQPISIDKTLDSKVIENEDIQIVDNQINQQEVLQNLNSMDGYFTKNMGQIENDSVEFYIPGGGVWFTADGVWFELREEIENRDQGSQLRSQGGVRGTPKTLNSQTHTLNYKRIILKQEFVGANEVKPVGREKLSWYSNFFYGNVSSNWRTSVPNYREVYYENIYKNIDLRYYSNEKGLKYDFIVHPGGDVQSIKLKLFGAREIKLENNSKILFDTQIGNCIDSNIIVFQNNNLEKKLIDAKYIKIDEFTYGFELLDKYNENHDLIIDPLIYSSYIGGTGGGYCLDLATDKQGNVFVSGYELSNDFPISVGAYKSNLSGYLDAYILKLNSNGTSLIFSTYIGGSNWEWGGNIFIDLQSNIHLVGTTNSSDFPYTNGSYKNVNSKNFNVFLLKLNSTCSGLFHSAIIGGSKDDRNWAFAMDSDGNYYFTGRTESPDFPTTNGSFDPTHNGQQDGFISK